MKSKKEKKSYSVSFGLQGLNLSNVECFCDNVSKQAIFVIFGHPLFYTFIVDFSAFDSLFRFPFLIFDLTICLKTFSLFLDRHSLSSEVVQISKMVYFSHFNSCYWNQSIVTLTESLINSSRNCLFDYGETTGLKLAVSCQSERPCVFFVRCVLAIVNTWQLMSIFSPTLSSFLLSPELSRLSSEMAGRVPCSFACSIDRPVTPFVFQSPISWPLLLVCSVFLWTCTSCHSCSRDTFNATFSLRVQSWIRKHASELSRLLFYIYFLGHFSGQKALKKRVLCYRLAQYNQCVQAVYEVALVASKKVPDGFMPAGWAEQFQISADLVLADSIVIIPCPIPTFYCRL